MNELFPELLLHSPGVLNKPTGSACLFFASSNHGSQMFDSLFTLKSLNTPSCKEKDYVHNSSFLECDPGRGGVHCAAARCNTEINETNLRRHSHSITLLNRYHTGTSYHAGTILFHTVFKSHIKHHHWRDLKSEVTLMNTRSLIQVSSPEDYIHNEVLTFLLTSSGYWHRWGMES